MRESPVRHVPDPGTSQHGVPAPTRRRRRLTRRAAVGLTVVSLAGTTLGVAITTGNAAAEPPGFLAQFSNVVPGPSTVPTNGDVNPYGIVVVPQSTGALVQGGVLVSNFNDSANAQGTGTTIVQEMPDGTVTQFARSTRPPRPGRARVASG